MDILFHLIIVGAALMGIFAIYDPDFYEIFGLRFYLSVPLFLIAVITLDRLFSQ